MKKNFFKFAMMMFVALVGVASMSSCKGDDDVESSIEGTWRMVEDDDEYATFLSNGTCYVYEYKAAIKKIDDCDKGTYSVDGNKVTIITTEDFMQVEVSIDGNNCVVTAMGKSLKFTKVAQPATTQQLEEAFQKDMRK